MTHLQFVLFLILCANAYVFLRLKNLSNVTTIHLFLVAIAPLGYLPIATNLWFVVENENIFDVPADEFIGKFLAVTVMLGIHYYIFMNLRKKKSPFLLHCLNLSLMTIPCAVIFKTWLFKSNRFEPDFVLQYGGVLLSISLSFLAIYALCISSAIGYFTFLAYKDKMKEEVSLPHNSC